MRLPDFLIIGAMKAGTTTLFRDLAVNPDCFFPVDKEPHNLIDEAVLSPAGLDRYAALFQKAREGQICGEASTGYSKRPTHEGVASRAKRVLGPGLKVVYIVREPVGRAISQHFHEVSRGQRAESIDDAVRRTSTFVDYSRYAWQLEPWIAELGRSQVMIVRFETYVTERSRTVAEVSRFLGLPPRPELVRQDAVYNRGDDRPLLKGFWTGLKHNPVYMRGIRPLLPRGIRDLAGRALLPRGPQRPTPPTMETVDYILDRVRNDGEQLRVLMGLSAPVWDEQSVRTKAMRQLMREKPGHDGECDTSRGLAAETLPIRA